MLLFAGEIGFSAALEDLSTSLYNGKLPPAWARLNPATEKPLGPWMAWFSRRQEQYKVRTTSLMWTQLSKYKPMMGGYDCAG